MLFSEYVPKMMLKCPFLQFMSIGLTKKSKSKRVPRYITVWMAYEVRTGNPFKKYTPLDFDVSRPPLDIQVTGADLLLNKHNVIQIEVQQNCIAHGTHGSLV